MTAGYTAAATSAPMPATSASLRKITWEFDRQLFATARRIDDITQQVEVAKLGAGQKDRGGAAGAGTLIARIHRQDFASARAAQGEISPAAVPQNRPPPRPGQRLCFQHCRPMAEGESPGNHSPQPGRLSVDLYLQPIVSLPQRKLRYYEALSRLRSQDGSGDHAGAIYQGAAPAGLMSVLDNLAAVPLRAGGAAADPEDA